MDVIQIIKYTETGCPQDGAVGSKIWNIWVNDLLNDLN